ncbi:MAG: CHASE3 domain-containing protein, partial [Nocardioides sp.]|nr:CHASE3 domain-containing protein [Nocardioides sp.]
MTLAHQVARVTRTAFLVVAVAALINMAMLAYLNLHLEAEAAQASDAERELRLAHEAMLDQETGLRAFLITGDEDNLGSHFEGRSAVGRHLDAARVLLVGNDEMLALLDAQDERQRAWTSQWADRAVQLGDSISSEGVGSDTREFVTEGRLLFDDYRAAHDEVEEAGSILREDTEADRGRAVKGSLALQVAVLCAGLLIVSRQLGGLRGAVLEPVQGLLDTIGELRDGNLSARSRPQGPAELRAV